MGKINTLEIYLISFDLEVPRRGRDLGLYGVHLPPIFMSICVLYNISESLSRFWSYVSDNFGCLVSLISLLSHDFSSQYPYLCYLPKILVPIFDFAQHMWVLFDVSIFLFLV